MRAARTAPAAPSSAVAAAFAVAGSLIAAPATAQLTQPDGTAIPEGGLLQTTFDGRGEQIDAVNDAATTPETFVPSCALTFEVLIRNAGYRNSFGWYNVTGAKPADAELHEFLTCTDDVGTSRVLDIRSDPGWAGGEVGFYQATGACGTIETHEAIFYSERGYNPDGEQANPFIHLLIYNSTVVHKAFYFGWEDLLSGGDNDFDDLTTFVTGISCSGGGEPCAVDGATGICAQGVMQCRAGELQCIATVEPQTEECNGFDDDCNDSIDEGDLCQAGFVCDKGNCVPRCSGGEFNCPAELVCDDDFCIDPACVDVECEAGERCVAGECKGPCEEVVCPFGDVCQLGVCLDPCATSQCDEAQVCEAGVCGDPCQCTGCEDASTCEDDGRCVAAACAGVECDAGTHCEAGACVDDCAGAVCPDGQVCEAGGCVPGATEGTGGSAASGAPTVTIGAGGEDQSAPSTSGVSTGGEGDGGASTASGSADAGESGPGCDCAVVGHAGGRDGQGRAALAASAFALLAASAMRRRRARARRAP